MNPKIKIYQNHLSVQGFTLIELLVVVIIIGVLSAIALPSYLNQSGKARASEARSSLGSIHRAQQAYYLEFGSMTGNLTDLTVSASAKFYTYQINLINRNNAEITARIDPASSIKDLKQYDSAVLINPINDFFGQILCESIQNNQLPGGATAPNSPGVLGTCNPASGRILN